VFEGGELGHRDPSASNMGKLTWGSAHPGNSKTLPPSCWQKLPWWREEEDAFRRESTIVFDDH